MFVVLSCILKLTTYLNSQYEGKRSGTLLKIKTFYDAEAIVTGYAAGKGRNKGVTGALKCKMASGKVRLSIPQSFSN